MKLSKWHSAGRSRTALQCISVASRHLLEPDLGLKGMHRVLSSRLSRSRCKFFEPTSFCSVHKKKPSSEDEFLVALAVRPMVLLCAPGKGLTKSLH